MVEREWTRETDGDLEDGAIWMADDDASDDRKDDDGDEATKEARDDESKGVLSDAGGTPMAVLASRLQTGQNVLHVVSQESTHIA